MLSVMGKRRIISVNDRIMSAYFAALTVYKYLVRTLIRSSKKVFHFDRQSVRSSYTTQIPSNMHMAKQLSRGSLPHPVQPTILTYTMCVL